VLVVGVETVAVVGVTGAVLVAAVLVAELTALGVTVTVLVALEPQAVNPTATSRHTNASRRFIARSLSAQAARAAHC
jgi:hypothetical protein